jgi:hypothetical protein
MFQFSRFASAHLCIQCGILSYDSGFPHSDIDGSKLHCQLPVAFRRLARPSSPVIAKASTTCTYSLDPITLNPESLQVLLQARTHTSFICWTVAAGSQTTIRCNHYPIKLPFLYSCPYANFRSILILPSKFLKSSTTCLLTRFESSGTARSRQTLYSDANTHCLITQTTLLRTTVRT